MIGKSYLYIYKEIKMIITAYSHPIWDVLNGFSAYIKELCAIVKRPTSNIIRL